MQNEDQKNPVNQPPAAGEVADSNAVGGEVVATKSLLHSGVNAVSVTAAASHYCDKCNRLADSDQMHYLWPFPLVPCEVSEKIELRDAGEMGFGVFAKEDIDAGEYLCCYLGILSHISSEETNYSFGIKLPNNAYSMTIDSKWSGNISRFVNHSYEPNCTSHTEYHFEGWRNESTPPYLPNHNWQYMRSKESGEKYYYYRNGFESVWEKPASDLVRWPIQNKEEPHIVFRASKKIAKDGQLFVSYGESYWKSRGVKPL